MSDTLIVVWTEIPVADIDRATAFYNAVFGWTMTVDTTTGPNLMAVLGGRMNDAGGHLYPGTPGQGPTVHIALPDRLEAGTDRCTKAGGTILGDPISLPTGRFVYATDTEGNSIGLFEAA
ncbi:MAG: VOC family protein [Flavimaricola sp.]|nr:VOC family protein [Flavimaricola sp.]